jgi:hypothetical protein
MRKIILLFVLCLQIFGNTDSVSASKMKNCDESGAQCVLGGVGPQGGIIFYAAETPQWWGQFIEALPVVAKKVDPVNIWGAEISIYATEKERTLSKILGMGSVNTQKMLQDPSSVAQKVPVGWSVPSKDELDALYSFIKLNSVKSFKANASWSSTELNANFAWYQEMRDGTQFTDANGVVRGLPGNKNTVVSQKHGGAAMVAGSEFAPMPFNVIPVRAFGAKVGVKPNGSISKTTVSTSCTTGVSCNIGDIGPGGGIVFYDAGTHQNWGRFLEIAPVSCEGVGLPWRSGKGTIYSGQTAAMDRVKAKQIGMGSINTSLIVAKLKGVGNVAQFATDSVCGGLTDWFLPSKDELDAAYNIVAQNRVGGAESPIGNFNKGYYWTSSDYNNKTAWTQYFKDGQQFDRYQNLTGNAVPPTPFRVRPVRAFG